MFTTFTVAPSYSPGKTFLEYMTQDNLVLARISVEDGKDSYSAELVIDGEAEAEIGGRLFKEAEELGEMEHIKIQNYVSENYNQVGVFGYFYSNFTYKKKATYQVVIRKNEEKLISIELDWKLHRNLVRLPSPTAVRQELHNYLFSNLSEAVKAKLSKIKMKSLGSHIMFDMVLRADLGNGSDYYDEFMMLESLSVEKLGGEAEVKFCCRPIGEIEKSGSILSMEIEYPIGSVYEQIEDTIDWIEKEVENCFGETI